MFPDSWDRDKIINEVTHAVENNKWRFFAGTDNEYYWFAKDGVTQINFYLNSDGSLWSYFPKILD